MTDFSPIRPDDAALVGLLSMVCDHALAAVRYRFTFPDDLQASREKAGVVASIDAVELRNAPGASCVITWGVEASDTGMAIVDGPLPDSGAAVVHAAGDPEWRDVIGQSAQTVYAGWQSNTGGPTLWALRLHFESADLVLAIGSPDDGTVMDELIVTRSRAVAASLDPPAAITDAWGGPSPLSSDAAVR